MITCGEMCVLSLEDYHSCSVWDMRTEKKIFTGDLRELMYSEYADLEAHSFGLNTDDSDIEFNVWTDDDD